MDTILQPLLAIFAIVVPLGLAYVIVLSQTRKPACVCPKVAAIAHDDLLQKRAEVPRAEEKHAAR